MNVRESVLRFIFGNGIIFITNSNRRNDSKMKRSLVLAAVLVVVLTAAAFGQDFGKFTMNIAEGWTGSQNGPTAIATKNDNTASFTVTVAAMEGATKAQLAEAFAAEFKKSFAEVGTPEADKDGDYSWDMKTANGVESHALLSSDGGDYVLMVMTNVAAAPDDFTAMIGSIEKK